MPRGDPSSRIERVSGQTHLRAQRFGAPSPEGSSRTVVSAPSALGCSTTIGTAARVAHARRPATKPGSCRGYAAEITVFSPARQRGSRCCFRSWTFLARLARAMPGEVSLGRSVSAYQASVYGALRSRARSELAGVDMSGARAAWPGPSCPDAIRSGMRSRGAGIGLADWSIDGPLSVGNARGARASINVAHLADTR